MKYSKSSVPITAMHLTHCPQTSAGGKLLMHILMMELFVVALPFCSDAPSVSSVDRVFFRTNLAAGSFRP